MVLNFAPDFTNISTTIETLATVGDSFSYCLDVFMTLNKSST